MPYSFCIHLNDALKDFMAIIYANRLCLRKIQYCKMLDQNERLERKHVLLSNKKHFSST